MSNFLRLELFDLKKNIKFNGSYDKEEWINYSIGIFKFFKNTNIEFTCSGCKEYKLSFLSNIELSLKKI